MNIGEMQRKLSLWADQDKERTFDDLYNLLYDPEWLRQAHDKVKSNAGSVTAGCDGITMSTFDETLEPRLQRLAEELKARKFTPQPVRRVTIPKAKGGTRPLGIPAIKDRIVQEALRMILEPIFEADFCHSSFGFRPGRRTMDAMKAITWHTQERKKFFWVIEGDIKSYFDSVKHKRLIKSLKRRITDKKLLALIRQFLKAGVMEGTLFKPVYQGVPQGGIISPILANVYLHELDVHMEGYTGLSQKEKTNRRKQELSNFTYVRYADDFVVFCNGTKRQAYEMRQELGEFLSTKLRLDLSLEKTKVTHLNDGFEFLGFKVRRQRGQRGITTKVDIPQTAKRNFLHKIYAATDRTTHSDATYSKFQALNRIIRGWSHYYKFSGHAGTDFNQLSYKVFWNVAHWLARKYKLTMKQTFKRYFFREEQTFRVRNLLLAMPRHISPEHYRQRFKKPNPYLASATLARETLPNSTYWTGTEGERQGMADLRQVVLSRDNWTCQHCGRTLTTSGARVHHKTPVRQFQNKKAAHYEANLIAVCIPCHNKVHYG